MFSKEALLAATFLLLLIYAFYQRRLRSKLPPGPPRLPIIGNLHQAPKSSPWLTFQKWLQEYGPLVSVDFAGTTLILIGDYDIAKDLLDKRRNIYSGRPRNVMAAELTCKNQHILLRQPDAQYILHQRLEAPVLGPRAASTYTPVQDMESKVLLYKFLHGNEVKENCEVYSASIAYVLAYGFRVITGSEWQIQAAKKVLDNFVFAAQPGAWLVDSLPLLKWLPGFLAPFKRKAEEYWKFETNLHVTNLREANKREGWNWSKDLSSAKEAQGMSEDELAWDIGILADAAVETSATFLETFFLACVAYPHIIATAQKEIDEVVGHEDTIRMPDFPDLDRLPYVHAIVEEVFRWRHIIPAGVAHSSLKDDWYNGFFIPKGSTIVPVWKAMREDSTRYDKPFDFIPERWLEKAGQPNNWGYGRRICAGRHIATNTITIAVARILWGFNVRPAVGERVTVNDDESMFTGGFVSHPINFEAVLEPRSQAHKEAIVEAYNSVDKDPQSLMSDVREAQIKLGLKPRC